MQESTTTDFSPAAQALRRRRISPGAEQRANSEENKRWESLYDELLEDEPDLAEAERSLRYRWRIPPAALIVIALFAGFCCLVVLLKNNSAVSSAQSIELATSAPASVEASEAQNELTVSGSSETLTLASSIWVHVAGEVNNPGIYQLSAGERVADAVQKAGGPTSIAQVDAINLAQELQDGQQVRIPAEGEELPVQEFAPQTMDKAAGSKSEKGTLININTASAEELQKLPRVGPVLSANIVAYREENGPYAAVEDLDQVPGIGPSMLANLTPLVRVS